MKHNINKQPKWVQEHIKKLEREIDKLQALKQAHALLIDKDRDWFTIPNNSDETMGLWIIHKDNPHRIASLGKDDVFLVGRFKKSS